MSIYKLAAGLAALAIGAAVVTAVAGVSAEMTAARTPVAAKSEQLDISADIPACAQEPWPYGCQWREPASRRVGRTPRPL